MKVYLVLTDQGTSFCFCFVFFFFGGYSLLEFFSDCCFFFHSTIFSLTRQDSLAQYPSLKENDDICFAGVEDSDFLSINAYDDVIDSVKPRGCDITSWPSAAVSYIESVPVHEAQISHINFGSKSSEPFSDADEGSPSKISSNIHIVSI